VTTVVISDRREGRRDPVESSEVKVSVAGKTRSDPPGRRAEGFRGLHWFAFATGLSVARLPGGSDRGFSPANGDFTSELSTGSVALPGGRI